MNDNKLQSDLEYHKYAVMFSHMDSLNCQNGVKKCRPDSDYFSQANANFTFGCERYKKNLKRYTDRYYAFKNISNSGAAIDLDAIKPPPPLFTPASFLTFGNSDNFSFVAIDDFDICVELVSDFKIPIQQTCIAFCPTLESLKIKSSYFCEMEDINKGAFFSDKNNLYVHPFTIERPLVSVTYFRVSSAAVLGPALLFLEAVYGRMARVIENTLREIPRGDELIAQEDIDSFKCMFFDPQGWSDVGAVMFCKNYSVIASVIMKLRSITLDDLYDLSQADNGDNLLKESVEKFGMHSEIARIWEDLRKRFSGKALIDSENYITDHLLRQNHVFCSTYTTLGMTHVAFMENKEQSEKSYNGLVSAITNFNVAPGHLFEIMNDDSKMSDIDENLLEEEVPVDLKDKYNWISVGLYDATHKEVFSNQKTEGKPLYDLIRIIKQLKGSIYDLGMHKSVCYLQDLCTDLSIPIHKKDIGESSKNENQVAKIAHVNLSLILNELRDELFAEKGELSIKKLQSSIRDLELPAPLSSSLVYVYSDYAKFLGDPIIFDNVLDLFGVFCAVYHLFTSELPRERDCFLEKYSNDDEIQESKRLSFLSSDDIEEITALVNLLENSLQHRTLMGFREAERWHKAIDIKSGLNQLVNATAVPLICGLSILKKLILNKTANFSTNSSINEQDAIFRTRIGGAPRIYCNPRVNTRRYKLGNPRINFLTDLGINVGHLIRPSSLYAHLHEIGHLICDHIRLENEADNELVGKYCSENYCRNGCFWETEHDNVDFESIALKERYDEIFSEMFIYRLVFGTEDANVYFRYYLATYFLDPISMCHDSEDTLCRLAEVLTRVFFAIDPFMSPKRSNNKNDFLYSNCNNYQLTTQDLNAAKLRFSNLLENTGNLFYDFDLFWNMSEAKGFIFEHFETIFKTSFQKICCIWNTVSKISGDILSTMDPNEKIREEINKSIEQGYNYGNPIVFYSYIKNKNNSSQAREKYSFDCVDYNAFYIVRQLLKIHIRETYKDFDKESEVLFSRLKPDLLKKNKISKQVLVRSLNGLGSADFEKRGQYMLNRITVLKSLWDISMAIQGKTFKDMILALRNVEETNDRRKGSVKRDID